MQNFNDGLVVELNKNQLRLLSSNLKISESHIASSVVNDTNILEVDQFTKEFRETLRLLGSRIDKAIFLLQEKDIYDRFFTVRNDETDVMASLVAQAAAFVGSPLDNLYSVFQKVSPFVYQFIGVNKNLVDPWVALAKAINLKIYAILPVSFVFTKFVGVFDPFFFVFRNDEEAALVASEYGGVYFSGTYTNTADINSKIEHLLGELSTFNREKPVTDLYYMGEPVTLTNPFRSQPLSLPLNIDQFQYRGYEKMLTALCLVRNSTEDISNIYYNLKNSLNKPEASGKDKMLSIVKYAAPAIVAVGALCAVLVVKFDLMSKFPAGGKPEVNGVSENSQEKTVVEEQDEASSSAEVKTEQAPEIKPGDL